MLDLFVKHIMKAEDDISTFWQPYVNFVQVLQLTATEEQWRSCMCMTEQQWRSYMCMTEQQWRPYLTKKNQIFIILA